MFGSTSYRKQAMHNNRNTLLETLTRLGVIQVCVTYEGGGDSGDIDSVSLIPVALEPLLKTENVTLCQVMSSRTEGGDWEYRLDTDEPCSLEEALTRFTLGWVGLAHSGWENNDGGAGSVTITVAENHCELEHREFYTESTVYEYTL